MYALGLICTMRGGLRIVMLLDVNFYVREVCFVLVISFTDGGMVYEDRSWCHLRGSISSDVFVIIVLDSSVIIFVICYHSDALRMLQSILETLTTGVKLRDHIYSSILRKDE